MNVMGIRCTFCSYRLGMYTCCVSPCSMCILSNGKNRPPSIRDICKRNRRNSDNRKKETDR